MRHIGETIHRGIISPKHKEQFVGNGFQSKVWGQRQPFASERKPVVFKTATLAWRISCLATGDPNFLEKRNKMSLELVSKYFPNHLVPSRFRQIKPNSLSLLVQERIVSPVELSPQNNPSPEVLQSLAEFAAASYRMYQETGYVLDLLGSGILHGMPKKIRENPDYWELPNLFILDGNRVGVMDICLLQMKNPTNIMDKMAKAIYRPQILQIQKRLGLKFQD